MRKAQIEIIGVALIVFILLLGGVFLYSRSLKRQEFDTGTYTEPELATTFLHTLMNTKTDNFVTVADTIYACHVNRDWCGTESCCDYATNVIQNALRSTLDEWGRSYRLTIRREGDIFIPPSGGSFTNVPPCTSDSEMFQPGFYYIPPAPRIEVKLEICRK